jgi:hypothetical protein
MPLMVINNLIALPDGINLITMVDILGVIRDNSMILIGY